MLKEGISYTSRMTVTQADTAEAVGSGGMPVFATPRMLGLMENAAMQAVGPELPEGDTTVGAFIESNHLAPTPVGAEVSATATLTRIDGRKLYFDVEAHQILDDGSKKLLGKGTHLRVTVNRDRFLAKL